MNRDVIKALKDMCADVLASPRWRAPDTPRHGSLVELSERLNVGKQYAAIRKSPDFRLLFETMESYEQALNDDWMPYEIVGLKLTKAKAFVERISEILETHEPSEFEDAVMSAYQKLR
jgi:hypothetical protein